MSLFQQYQAEFTGHIRNPKAVPPPKGVASRGMQVYAEIVFNNMEDTLAACFPVAKRILGVRRWTRLVRSFFAEHRCTSPLFRQIPEEFLRYLEQAPDAMAGLPPFLYSLAHYEWIELALTLSDAILPDNVQPDGDLLAGRPALAPALALLSYPYPVQQLSPRFKPTQPDAEPTHIVAFRRQDDEVKFIVLNPVSARLLGLLQTGTLTGQQVLEQIAAEMQHPDPQAVIQHGAELLEDLRRQGVVWGVLG